MTTTLSVSFNPSSTTTNDTDSNSTLLHKAGNNGTTDLTDANTSTTRINAYQYSTSSFGQVWPGFTTAVTKEDFLSREYEMVITVVVIVAGSLLIIAFVAFLTRRRSGRARRVTDTKLPMTNLEEIRNEAENISAQRVTFQANRRW